MQDLDLSRTFIGKVEANNDPKRLGRIRVRVMDVFDNIPTNDIPWATPSKDLNGNQFILPEVGKIVSVKFENESIYTPVYYYAEHYNINLENKLKDLSDKDYKSMRALLFDHKTQVYSNDSEGLKMDYKMNNMNVTNTSIDLNLKGNTAKVNLGTATADQSAILGDNFLDWFDKFVDELIGKSGGAFIGNMTAPTITAPGLLAVLFEYKALKDPKFLSRNVSIVDNFKVDKISRPVESQTGDDWKSTIEENELVIKEKESFEDIGDHNIEGNLTTNGNPNDPITNDSDLKFIEPPQGDFTPDIEVLLDVMRTNNFVLLERPNELNIIGLRKQFPGQEYSDKFKDRLYALWKDTNGEWRVKDWKLSTIPGRIDFGGNNESVKDKHGPSVGGLGILKEGQYINGFKLGYHKREQQVREARALRSVGPQYAYRDTNYASQVITYSKEDKNNSKGGKNFGMHIHKAYSLKYGTTSAVRSWSLGCQVIPDAKSLNQFMDLCEVHKDKYGNSFNYTLITSRDIEASERRIKNNN